jgi:hypothetical protein
MVRAGAADARHPQLAQNALLTRVCGIICGVSAGAEPTLHRDNRLFIVRTDSSPSVPTDKGLRLTCVSPD